MSKRFTASRVPDAGVEALFGTEERWQAWVAIESALALSQADVDMIPREAADAITSGHVLSNAWILDVYGKGSHEPVIH
jgi:adenylosuccinate lyase